MNESTNPFFVRIARTSNKAKVLEVGFGKPSAGDEIVKAAQHAIESVDPMGPGTLLISGPMTLPAAFVIAHKVVHLVSTVAVFDPKLAAYLVVANHGGAYRVGDIVRESDFGI